MSANGIIQISDMNIGVVILAMLGKFCISASYAIIYVFSAELFPTVVRTIGVGSGSFCARIGGILAPQIGLLVNKYLKFNISYCKQHRPKQYVRIKISTLCVRKNNQAVCEKSDQIVCQTKSRLNCNYYLLNNHIIFFTFETFAACMYLQRDVSKFAPLIVFGVSSLLAGALALLLPETMGKNLPETLEDGESFGTKHDRYITIKHSYCSMGIREHYIK